MESHLFQHLACTRRHLSISFYLVHSDEKDQARLVHIFDELVPDKVPVLEQQISELSHRNSELESKQSELVAKIDEFLKEVEKLRQQKPAQCADLPHYWETTRPGCPLVEWKVKNWLHSRELTHEHCESFGGDFTSTAARLLNVELNKQPVLWNEYRAKQLAVRTQLQKAKHADLPRPHVRLWDNNEHLAAELKEVYLFHGLPPDVVRIARSSGLDPRLARESGLYGAGVYFTPQRCKAWQYATLNECGERFILLCRVTLGHPHETDRVMKGEKAPPVIIGTDNVRADSVVAYEGPKATRHPLTGWPGPTRNQVHTEYVVFERTQIYPEYVLKFKVV